MGGKLSYPAGVKLDGKVVIVTGGNSGIGYEIAKGLARMGAHTIIACRSEERARQAIDRMKQEVAISGEEMNVEFMQLDLASLESTKNFVQNFKQKNLPLHVLLCNAGVVMVGQGKTENNLETHFQVNHLGHFFICLELLPCMAATEGDKRIVLVSSAAAKSGSWHPNNLQGDVGYGRLKFYSHSKMYNVMTSYALQRRVKDDGITVSSVEPGYVSTGMSRSFEDAWHFYYADKALKMFGMARSPEQGAVPAINCAMNPTLNSQQAIFYASCTPARPSVTAGNERYQEELWSASCDLLKEWISPEVWARYGAAGNRDAPAGEVVSDKEEESKTAVEN